MFRDDDLQELQASQEPPGQQVLQAQRVPQVKLAPLAAAQVAPQRQQRLPSIVAEVALFNQPLMLQPLE